MAKLHDEWEVLPHGHLIELDEGLLTVVGDIPMPLGNFPRRMTVVGLAGKRTAIWSAIPLGESAMARIEELGRPAVLIVPGQAHRLDAAPWKARYPDITVLCAPGARAAVSEAVTVDTTDGAVLADPAVRFEVVPGVSETEAALWVTRRGGKTLILNDVIGNVQHPHGIGAWILSRALHFGSKGPEVPGPGKKFVTDFPALAAAFRRWADEPDLRRVVVSHGDVISDHPAAALRAVADDISDEE